MIKLMLNYYRSINAVKETEREIRQTSLPYEVVPSRVVFERALREKKPAWELNASKRDREFAQEIRRKLSSLIGVEDG